MDYLGDKAGLGLTTDQTEKVLQFQDLTGIEDMTVCRDVLQRHQWNLEVAVQEQLNIREGRPTLYATETRPPAVINDDIGQHIFYTPPTDGSGSGLRGVIRSIMNFFLNFCYKTILTIFQIGRRFLGSNARASITNPIEDVLNFIRMYEEKYSNIHPVFYQGTYSQVLNDAKRELKFLLIYLHNDSAVDTTIFCRDTLADSNVVNYVNNHFFFWAISVNSDEGQRVTALYKPSHFPFLAIVVLKDNRMTIVSRMEGYCDSNELMRRLGSVVALYEINLIQARADRYEQSVNRSLRQHQDEAFLESLKADQEKERIREEQRLAAEEEQRLQHLELLAEEERRQSIAREKIESVNKVPEEPDANHPDAVHVVIKLPCGTRLDRRFLKTHSLEAIFYFVFCHPSAPDLFEITTNFPKRVLHCRPEHPNERIQTLAEAGLTNREVLFINDLEA